MLSWLKKLNLPKSWLLPVVFALSAMAIGGFLLGQKVFSPDEFSTELDLSTIQLPAVHLTNDRYLTYTKADFRPDEDPKFTLAFSRLTTVGFDSGNEANRAHVISDTKDSQGSSITFAIEKIKDILSPELAHAKTYVIKGMGSRVLDRGRQPTFIQAKFQHFLQGQEENWGITLEEPSNTIRPGLYTLQLGLVTENELLILEQDFSWGVLAINMNKSIYTQSDETAYIQMGVLGNTGHTICDASLELTIISPLGSKSLFETPRKTVPEQNTELTRNGRILYSGKCKGDTVVDAPDYFAYYEIPDEVGKYEMRLSATTRNGTHSITDFFVVEEYVPFDVERIGPTRIYPLADYEMKYIVRANENFAGVIVEAVPDGFRINDQFSTFNFQSISNDSISKQLIWEAELEAGEAYEFSYTFDAPDVSPEFYLLGPLEFRETSSVIPAKASSDVIPAQAGIQNLEILDSRLRGNDRRGEGQTGGRAEVDSGNDRTVFREVRQWQIASDATSGTTTFHFKARASDSTSTNADTHNSMILGFPQETVLTSTGDLDSPNYAGIPPCEAGGTSGGAGGSAITDAVNQVSIDVDAIGGPTTGDKCVATFYSLPVGQTITIESTDTGSLSVAYYFITTVEDGNVNATFRFYQYDDSAASTSIFGTLVDSNLPSGSSGRRTVSGTPSVTRTLDPEDRIIVVWTLNIILLDSSGGQDSVGLRFDDETDGISYAAINYTLIAPYKPDLSGSADDDFTNASTTAPCTSGGVAYKNWTCITPNGSGEFNAHASSSQWLILNNIRGASGENFGATPDNTYMYQTVPSGDGNITTVVNNALRGFGATSTHSGLLLWTSDTDYLILGVHSTTSNDGIKFLNIDNSGAFSATTTLTANWGRVWLRWAKTGTNYQASYSIWGTTSTFTDIGSAISHPTAFTRMGLNVFASSADTEYSGAFEYFDSTLAPPAGFAVSGTVYLADEVTPATSGNGGPCDGTTVITIRVNGASPVTGSCSGTDASYSISGIGASAGDTITVYLTSLQKANTVYVSDGSADTTVHLFINAVIVRDEQDGTVTIADLLDYDNTDNNTDMLFNATTSPSASTTLDSGVELHVYTLDTFDPGGQVNTIGTGDFHVSTSSTAYFDTATSTIGDDVFVDTGGTLNIDDHVLIEGGSATTSGTGTITRTIGSADVTIRGTGYIGGGTGNITIYNLRIGDGTTASTTLNSNATTTTDTTVGTGSQFSVNSNLVVAGGDLATITTGIITSTAGTPTVTMRGTGNVGGGTGSITVYNLLVGDAQGTAVTTLASSATSTTDVTVATGSTFNVNSDLVVAGGDLTNTTTGIINTTSGTPTVTMRTTGSVGGGSGQITLYNLNVGDYITAVTTLASSATTTNDTAVATGSTFNINSNFFIDGGDLTTAGTGIINYTSGTPTVDIDGTGTLGGGSGNITFYTLDLGDGTTDTTTLSSAITGINNNLTVNSSQTFSVGTNPVTVGLSSVTNSGGIAIASGATYSQTGGTTTVSSSDAGSSNIGGAGSTTFYNLAIGPSSVDNLTYTIRSAGNITVSNDLTVQDAGGADNHAFDINTNDNAITAQGNFLIDANATYDASSNVANRLTIAGNFTSNGTFNHRSGEIAFNNSSLTSSLLYAANIFFNNFTVNTAGKALQFDETERTNIGGTLSLQGSDCTTGRIFLDSTTNDNQWDINATSTVDIDFVEVEDSNAITALTANNSSEVNNSNTNWTINICSRTVEFRKGVEIRRGTEIR